MRFGKLEMDPARNPGVLDTATWDRRAGWDAVERIGEGWDLVRQAAAAGRPLPEVEGTVGYSGSLAKGEGGFVLLARLPDAQEVFVEIGNAGAEKALGEPLGRMVLGSGAHLAAYPTDAGVVDRFCLLMKPEKGPRALGCTPRIGTGARMSAAVWPGVFKAMDERGFAAIPIQNSVRELNLLEDLLDGRPAPRNYACGFGMIESGYTGSTFEGLWLAGVLAALRHDRPLTYGADADHIQVKRGPDGLARAKRVIDAARHYTFYTLDVSDILNYAALADGPDDYLQSRISNAQERRDVLAYHTEGRKIGSRTYQLDEASIRRFVGKYWDALEALSALAGHIVLLADGRPFDLEFAIDEHPPEVHPFDCLTAAEETLFVLREIERRGLPVTQIAPNFGVEKGWDYRAPDGLDGLERRVRAHHEIAQEFGVLLDFHSADDLTSGPRTAFRRATGGKLHYKVSPMLQLLFAEVLQAWHPDLFQRWWDDAFAYAEREAKAGSEFAAWCVEQYRSSADQSPSRHHMVFHHYGFPFVGRRDANGRFLHRHEFYSLSQGFYDAYRDRVAGYLCELADDLFE